MGSAPPPNARSRSASQDAPKEADMNHHDIDPSLRTAEPLLDSLDDGFSPPADAKPQGERDPGQAEPSEIILGPKSPF
jgi:hypothetical protein